MVVLTVVSGAVSAQEGVGGLTTDLPSAVRGRSEIVAAAAL